MTCNNSKQQQHLPCHILLCPDAAGEGGREEKEESIFYYLLSTALLESSYFITFKTIM